jgi:predicted regulator of amino acid metabolism with ACT domain
MEKLLEMEKKTRKTADPFYAIEGTKVFTIILSEKYLDDFKKLFGRNILKTSKNLTMITIKSPTDMENTPGVIAYITSLFSEHGINIVETMSCWTDTIFIVTEQDMPVVMQFFNF